MASWLYLPSSRNVISGHLQPAHTPTPTTCTHPPTHPTPPATLPHTQELLIELPQAPASLTALSQLQTLRLHQTKDLPGALPPGPWLHSVQELAATCGLLSRSLPALGTARRLQRLRVILGHDAGPINMFGWVARSTSLQHLTLGDTPLGSRAWPAMLEAQRKRPGLRIWV